MLRSRVIRLCQTATWGMSVTTDPRDLIAKNPMTAMQILVVGITIALNALDGFDVLSISFASPGIAAEWGIERAALGFVLSMELIGMALGSIFLGGVADKIGRRPTVLGCLIVMALGMFMVTTTSGVLGGALAPVINFVFGANLDSRLVDLSIWRIITGLGIGGMLASINAVVAEFSNTRRRDLNVAIMSIGYPVGAAARRLHHDVVARARRLAFGVLLRRHRHHRVDSDRVLLHAGVRALARAQAARGRAREDQPHA